jgi:anaerobic ribonucleoside-triphosphate reductase
MKIIKRSGSEVDFDITKIIAAITKANNEVLDADKLTANQIREIAAKVENKCKAMSHAASVEEIQDMVENQLMAHSAYTLARIYITYRYTHALIRRSNTTDEQILSLIECNNEEVKQENSNKNPSSTASSATIWPARSARISQSVYCCLRTSSRRTSRGIIHFHDADYFAQHMHNCDLVNLEDMLQNGTVISGTMIEKPHSFSTACNIATQIIAQVASNQYGGQSISLTHLAPFVEVSRDKIREDVSRRRSCSARPVRGRDSRGRRDAPSQRDKKAACRRYSIRSSR